MMGLSDQRKLAIVRRSGASEFTDSEAEIRPRCIHPSSDQLNRVLLGERDNPGHLVLIRGLWGLGP